jgi:hypothetical protein
LIDDVKRKTLPGTRPCEMTGHFAFLQQHKNDIADICRRRLHQGDQIGQSSYFFNSRGFGIELVSQIFGATVFSGAKVILKVFWRFFSQTSVNPVHHE